MASTGFVVSTFSQNIKRVFVPPHDDVLDSDRPGGEAARFCRRTLKQKKNW